MLKLDPISKTAIRSRLETEQQLITNKGSASLGALPELVFPLARYQHLGDELHLLNTVR